MQAAIVITGAAQRVGLALAKSFVSEGHKVIVSYRTLRPGIKELQQLGVVCIQADFEQQQDIDAFIVAVKNQCCSIRLLVHNASDWLAERSDLAPNIVFQRMMQIHANVPYQLTQALADYLKADGGGDVIAMTDFVAGSGSKKHVAYAASKAALENMVKSFASLYSPTVKVNGIAPGLLMFNLDDDEAYKAKALSKSLLGNEPGAQVVIDSVAYLMNSTYLTGHILALDGGRSLAQKNT
ncbi:dihydromonapterin reductase [Echinimonas agarilytica]|uniref:Dihydromonapterin reductase n=1 Tax=Echinimonas agarilytica TaxID=1215918 RepID=A0AA41W550_9GAMM|nr:dihydromonapterin reductase [Echinimonas agarilytica]MCM2679050.1 dihydromonapterin reductase [Echinimonas agarilytica]